MSIAPWITKQSLKDGGYWTLIQVCIGLLPLWGTALLLVLVSKKLELYDLLRNGEFVLYAASFVTGGLYSLRHDIFPLRNVLFIVLTLILAIATLIFAAISVINIGARPEWLTIDKDILTTVSVVVFVASTLLCIGIAVAEAGNAGVNIPERLRKDRKMLEVGLDKLLGEGKQ